MDSLYHLERKMPKKGDGDAGSSTKENYGSIW
jgi:hypothetical protein